jgi:O-antigen/teichoic acid export membrane protein
MISYLVIIPRLSMNISSYGIYSLVMSLMIFLQYADFGFLGAGQKYAAECYVRNERVFEINILGFVHFILLIVILLYVLLLTYVYFHPGLLFNSLNMQDEILVKSLILVFICSSPVILFQRLASSIFTIRLEEYLFQYFEIVSSMIKIFSTFYFFRDGSYEILNYVIFIQFMNLLSVAGCFIVIRFKYQYNIKSLIYAFRFQKSLYDLTKVMAMTSVIVTITWMLYYEFDLIYVSKLYTHKMVAIFAIGITMLTFSRSLMNAFFGPFQTKFNHLKGMKDDIKLNHYFSLLIHWSFPISILPALTIIIMMQSLIISWIGTAYTDSIWISRILICNLFFSFLSVPISYLAMAKEKFRFVFISSLFLPLFYFFFFLILYKRIGYFSIPTAKVLTIFLNLIFSIFLLRSILIYSVLNEVKKMFSHIVLPLLLLFGLLFLFYPYWGYPSGKNIYFFLRVLSIGGISTFLSMMLYYFINPVTKPKLLVLKSIILSKLNLI